LIDPVVAEKAVATCLWHVGPTLLVGGTWERPTGPWLQHAFAIRRQLCWPLCPFLLCSLQSSDSRSSPGRLHSPQSIRALHGESSTGL